MRKNHKCLKALLAAGMAAFLFAEGALAGTLQMGYVPEGHMFLNGTYYYSDSYFLQSGKTDNTHLLSLSLSLACTTDNSAYTEKLMKDIGFSDLSLEDMGKGTRDTIGSVIGHKQVGDRQLVCVVVRGLGYTGEWASNMLVGAEGNVRSFQTAADKVLARLKTYLETYGITSPKIWVSGYSRGASTTNLIGEYINQHLEEFGTTEDDLYIYAFEPTQTSVSQTVYPNMVSVQKIGDLVTSLFPESWGLHFPGKVITLGESFTVPQYSVMSAIFKVDPSTLEKVDAQAFLKEFMDFLGQYLTRQDYASIEEDLAKVVELYFSLDEEKQKTLVSLLGNEFIENVKSNETLIGQVFLLLGNASTELVVAMGNVIVETLINTLKGKSFPLSEEEYGYVSTALTKAVEKLAPMLVADLKFTLSATDAVGSAGLDDYEKGRSEGFYAGLRGEGQEGIEGSQEYISGYEKGYALAKSFKEHVAISFEAAYDGVVLPPSQDTVDGEDVMVGDEGTPTQLYHLSTLGMSIFSFITPHEPTSVMEDVAKQDPYFQQYPDTPDPGQADLIIPEGVTEIAEEAFAGNAARFVVIPETCTLVGERAFADCPNLEVVYFEDINKVEIADSYLDGSGKSDIFVAAGYTK